LSIALATAVRTNDFSGGLAAGFPHPTSANATHSNVSSLHLTLAKRNLELML
jgi:hypothetical protein